MDFQWEKDDETWHQQYVLIFVFTFYQIFRSSAEVKTSCFCSYIVRPTIYDTFLL